jgi:O-antigen ligase
MADIATEKTTKLNLYIERITFVITLIICAVVPLITYPKALINGNGYVSQLDFFAYYKSIANYMLAIFGFTILSVRIFLIFTGKDKIEIKYSLLMFTLWVAVSTVFAVNFNVAMFGLGLNYQGLLAYLGYFIFFTVTVNSLNRNNIGYLIYATLASSTVIAILCLLEFYGIDLMDLFAETGIINFPTVVHATFGNSNYVGSYFSLMTPLAIVTYLGSKNSSKINYLLFSSAACFAGLVVCTSRISWISVFIAIIIGLFYIEKSRVLYKRLLVITALAFVITSTLNSTSGSSITEKYASGVGQFTKTQDIRSFGSSRFFIYDRLISQTFGDIKRSLVGVGPDCLVFFGEITDEDKIKYPFLPTGGFAKAHSDLIEYAASMGVPALVFYICFITSILFPWFKNKEKPSPETTGVFAAWLGYLIQSMFNVPTIGIVSIFFIFSAIINSRVKN